MMAGLLPMSEPCLLRTCSCLQVIPELEMLHDVHLDSVLGYGGFAAVLRGRGVLGTPPSLQPSEMIARWGDWLHSTCLSASQ
jgi:hypothetical protein